MPAGNPDAYSDPVYLEGFQQVALQSALGAAAPVVASLLRPSVRSREFGTLAVIDPSIVPEQGSMAFLDFQDMLRANPDVARALRGQRQPGQPLVPPKDNEARDPSLPYSSPGEARQQLLDALSTQP